MDSARLASSRVSKTRSMSKVNSYHVDGSVQELTCEPKTRRERKWKSGSTVNWSLGVPTSSRAIGTMRKKRFCGLKRKKKRCFLKKKKKKSRGKKSRALGFY